jgi:hypothetical protein
MGPILEMYGIRKKERARFENTPEPKLYGSVFGMYG